MIPDFITGSFGCRKQTAALTVISKIMKPYIAIVHKDPDSAYGLSFPDAPGCFSAADDIDDVFANASEAITLWTEAMIADRQKIPAPREFSELKRDPHWAESFADAALVIAVAAPRHDGQAAA
jgi:predicted RNase H-like HicB family nuclease